MIVNKIDGISFEVTLPTWDEITEMRIAGISDLLSENNGQLGKFLTRGDGDGETRLALVNFDFSYTPILKVKWNNDGWEFRSLLAAPEMHNSRQKLFFRPMLRPLDGYQMEDPNGSIFEGGSFYYSDKLFKEPELYSRDTGAPFEVSHIKTLNSLGVDAHFGDTSEVPDENIRWLLWNNNLLCMDLPVRISPEDMVSSGLVRRGL